MLSQIELQHLLREPGIVLALDTNVLRQSRRLLELADRVNQLNKSPTRHIEVVIPAPAHGERIFQLRRLHGAAFSVEKVREFFAQKGVSIPAFDLDAAEGVAEALAQLFPDDRSWGMAKVKSALRRLGLPDTASAATRFPGTIDWLIAGQCYIRDWVLITDDTGNEFKVLRRRVQLEVAQRALDAEWQDSTN